MKFKILDLIIVSFPVSPTGAVFTPFHSDSSLLVGGSSVSLQLHLLKLETADIFVSNSDVKRDYGIYSTLALSFHILFRIISV